MDIDKVKDCLTENPDMELEKIVERTGLSFDKVTALVCNLAIKAEKKQNEESIPICMTGSNQIDIMKMLEADPFKRFDDELSLQINDILSDNKKDFDKRFELIKPMMINKIYKDLENDKQFALSKLKDCGQRGSRWLELKIRAQSEQAKLLGLEPDKNNKLSVTIGRSKEELDAIYQASMTNMFGEVLDATSR
jgi:hypothetical protein